MSETLVKADPRLIIPLDLPTVAEARAIVDALSNTVSFYKVGLELFATGGGMTLAGELKAKGKTPTAKTETNVLKDFGEAA